MVREFWVSEGREADFRKVFGASGIWPELLGRSGEYLGTRLRQESEADRRYQIFDYWQSHSGFEEFREKYQVDCQNFSLLIANEGLVEREILLGSFYADESDWDEGTDLVSS